MDLIIRSLQVLLESSLRQVELENAKFKAAQADAKVREAERRVDRVVAAHSLRVAGAAIFVSILMAGTDMQEMHFLSRTLLALLVVGLVAYSADRIDPASKHRVARFLRRVFRRREKLLHE